MSKKEYRVVCAKERFKDDIIVDIVPANGIIHEMIFASRKKQNPKLEDYAGSVFLTEVEGAEPEVFFASLKALPKHYCESMSKQLTPLILDTYKKMKSSGREATLNINLRDYFAMYSETDKPQTLKGEDLKEYTDRCKKIEQYKKDILRRRSEKDALHKPEIMLAWRQALNRGD